MKQFIKRFAIFLVFFIVLYAGLSYLMPVLYRILPSDYKRHLLLTEVLAEKANIPEIVVFGDSQAMFGINTNIISDNIKTHPLVYNLSSVGQGMNESPYFYSFVNLKTKIVIQCTEATFLKSDSLPMINNQKALSMILGGYKINDEVRNLVANVNPNFNDWQIVSYLKSGYYLKSLIHNVIRPFIDNEVFSDNSMDRYFPNPFIADRHPNYPFYKLNCNDYGFTTIPSQKLSYINKFVEYFKKRDIKYYLVIMPVNTELCPNVSGKLITAQLSGIKDLSVIDAVNLLEGSQFYDGVHANRKGARKLSELIARTLQSDLGK